MLQPFPFVVCGFKISSPFHEISKAHFGLFVPIPTPPGAFIIKVFDCAAINGVAVLFRTNVLGVFMALAYLHQTKLFVESSM